jgi:hypothetical protein
MECGYDKNGPKRRKTRRLGHTYVFFYFSPFIYCTNYCLQTTAVATTTLKYRNTGERSKQHHDNLCNDTTGHCQHLVQQQQRRQQGARGPYTRHRALIGGLGWAAETKTGPNDASGPVGTFLFFCLFIF